MKKDIKVTEMTIGQLEADRCSSVWVLNSARPVGNLHISVPNGMGQNLTVSVLVSWVPQDLTTQATKASVLSSPVFRRMLAKKMLTIISEESAMALLSEPDAAAEQARLYNMAQEITASTAAIPEEVQSMQAEASGKVSGFAMQTAHSELEEGQVLNIIKGSEHDMTREDAKYIADNSKHPKVKEYMAKKLLSQPA
jgi:hypothetical protein